MKKFTCIYAIVRFTPFVETGEFANVGIVLFAPEKMLFGFRLLQEYDRVTNFFEPFDTTAYIATMKNLHDELERLSNFFVRAEKLIKTPKRFSETLFAEVIKSRETVIQFSEPRVVIAEDLQIVNDLFNHYVQRDFVAQNAQEKILEHQNE